MSDGSGGIRAVMISTAHHSLLLNVRDRMRLPTTAAALEALVEYAHKNLTRDGRLVSPHDPTKEK